MWNCCKESLRSKMYYRRLKTHEKCVKNIKINLQFINTVVLKIKSFEVIQNICI